MLSTLKSAREDYAIRSVAGNCNTSLDFLALINTATRRLLSRGDWVGTISTIYVCAYRGCVVWPRYVGEVRKVNVCGQPISMSNMWWKFMPREQWCGADGWAVWSGWPNWNSRGRMLGNGETPVFQDVLGEGRLIRAYPRCQADIGRYVTIFGTDNNGQTLTTRQPDNTWTEGVTITLDLPFGSTSTFVRHIDRVLKDETQCPVDMYGYHAETDTLEEMAHYEPSETNPAYVRQELGGMCNLGIGTGCCPVTLQALVKLRYVAARSDTDLILIENLDALALMIQAIKAEQANDRQLARGLEADAIRELNSNLFNRDGYDKIPVNMGELGNTSIGRPLMF
jgi:hypothetical protein